MMADTTPAWLGDLKQQYLAGSSNFFILHGNVDDLVGVADSEGGYMAEPLTDFLVHRLLGEYDLVLHYDIGRGLRPHPGGDPVKLSRMNHLLDRLAGGSADLPRIPEQALFLLDRLMSLVLMESTNRPALKTAFLFDYAELICPPGDRETENLAMLLNWARSPIVRRVNMIFILMAQNLSQLHPALVQNAYTSEIQIPMPDREKRLAHIRHACPEADSDVDRLGRLTSGLTLSNIDRMLRLIRSEDAAGGDGLSRNGAVTAEGNASKSAGLSPSGAGWHVISRIKKQMIEAQCPGLIEFIEPKLDLSLVAGHFAAKKRLADDAELIRRGELEAVPMGYLLCGPVGSGKTFLAQCYAGTVGIPCVILRNFRSKYVGETEANLERVLRVLRELGPVAVIIDEADAAVGNREASGDSGTSARVFAQLASQMGDTKYRGRMIWFMLTCRPDLLPVDLKRQGRCEEHIPLFYPETPDEYRDMFLAMARKQRLALAPETIPDHDPTRPLSGADIESLLTRAGRESLIRNEPVSAELLREVQANFNSPRGPEHELQELAAILECSDLRYLPDRIRKVVQAEGGLDGLTQRYRELHLELG